MVDSVYRVDSRAADGTAEAKWAFDDISDELARAGYGMGAARFALPFLPETHRRLRTASRFGRIPKAVSGF